jgi:hypothetical protein
MIFSNSNILGFFFKEIKSIHQETDDNLDEAELFELSHNQLNKRP